MNEGTPLNFGRTKRRTMPGSERGFSLAEVLVAVAMLSVILLALFGLVSAGVRRAYGGKKMTQATALAQAILERASVYAPHELLGAAGTATTASKSWSRTGPSSVTPAAESGTADNIVERNAWRTMLAQADLPATASKPATLTVTATPVPTGAFETASMVRVVVDLQWSEYGTRTRQVRLQTLNLRDEP